MLGNIGAWVDGNPIAILAVAIIIMVFAGRSLLKQQGSQIGKLIDSVLSLSDSVTRLEILYRDHIIKQGAKQNDMEIRLVSIEQKIDDCNEEKQ